MPRGLAELRLCYTVSYGGAALLDSDVVALLDVRGDEPLSVNVDLARFVPAQLDLSLSHNGRPLARANVMVERLLPDGRLAQALAASTDGDGRLRLHALAGTYRFVLHTAGAAPVAAADTVQVLAGDTAMRRPA